MMDAQRLPSEAGNSEIAGAVPWKMGYTARLLSPAAFVAGVISATSGLIAELD
jgi:hypothetical protein